MLIEKGTVVAIDSEHGTLLVQTARTGCGDCHTKGCGQGLLARYLSGKPQLRIAPGPGKAAADYRVGDQLELGLDEGAMLRAAALVYLAPLGGLLAGCLLGTLHSEAASMLAALIGLCIGGFYVRRQSQKRAAVPTYAPVILNDPPRHAIS